MRSSRDGGAFLPDSRPFGLKPFLLRPIDDLHRSVGMLNQRRAALHPVAVVVVSNVADHADLGGMDVTADDAVRALLGRRMGNGMLEAGDELDGVLDALLK